MKSNRFVKFLNTSIILLALLMLACVIALRGSLVVQDFARLSDSILNGSWSDEKIIVFSVGGGVAFLSLFCIIKNLLLKKSIFLPVLFFGIAFSAVFYYNYQTKFDYWLNTLFEENSKIEDYKIYLGYCFMIFGIILALLLIIELLIAIKHAIVAEKKVDVEEEFEVNEEEDPIARIIRIAKEEIAVTDNIIRIEAIVEKAHRDIDKINGVQAVPVEEAETEQEVVEENEEVVEAVEAEEENEEVEENDEVEEEEDDEVVEEDNEIELVKAEPEVELTAEEIAHLDEAALAFFLARKAKARRAKSFEFKLRSSRDELKTWYSGIKNELLSYRRIRSRVSRSCDSFRKGRVLLTKINVVGKTIKVFFALEIEKYEESKFHQKFVGDKTKYKEVPFMIRVRSNRGYKHAIELVGEIMNKNGFVKNPKYVPFDYVQFYLPDSQSILRSLGLENLLRDKIKVDEVDILNDENAACLVQPLNIEMPANEKLVNAIINIDDVSKVFGPNEVVNLESLKSHKLITRKVNNVKVLARGEINKPLTVYANDFSLNAVKMIVLTGGNVIEYK